MIGMSWLPEALQFLRHLILCNEGYCKYHTARAETYETLTSVYAVGYKAILNVHGSGRHSGWVGSVQVLAAIFLMIVRDCGRCAPTRVHTGVMAVLSTNSL